MRIRTESIRASALLLGFATATTVGCRSETARLELAAGADAAAVIEASVERPDDGSDRSPLRPRRLWAGEQFNFYASSPSPDGRYVTEIDWGTGDLAVRDLSSGSLHHLTDKGSWDDSGDYAEVSRFSPDGRRIAYAWFDAARRTYQVRVLDFSIDDGAVPRGSNARVVYAGGPVLVYWLYGWSPADELLVGVYRPDNTTALAFLSLESGSLRVLKSFDWQDSRAALSPDGKWVAYDHSPGPDLADRDIYLLSADGRHETKLVERPGADVVLGWTPEGGSLLIHSEGPGSPTLWRLPVADGRAAGPAELLREDVGTMEPLGFAGDAFYFGVVVETPSFRTASIDFERKRITRLPTDFRAPSTGELRALAWSPDGQHVVHDVHGPVGMRIYLRTAAGKIIREWTFDLRMRRWLIRWAPDGRSVILPALDSRGREGFYRITLESGELETIRQFERGASDASFSISPDGRHLYYVRARTVDGRVDESHFEIVSHNLTTGSERPIQRVRFRGPVLVSPDGEWLAYKERAQGADPTIQLFPARGGEPRILHRVSEGGIYALVAWTPDGRSLLFTASPNYPDPPIELWRVSRAGGDAERLGETPEWRVDGPALHPDGRTIAYRAGQPRGEIWAIDGLGGSASTATELEGSR